VCDQACVNYAVCDVAAYLSMLEDAFAMPPVRVRERVSWVVPWGAWKSVMRPEMGMGVGVNVSFTVEMVISVLVGLEDSFSEKLHGTLVGLPLADLPWSTRTVKMCLVGVEEAVQMVPVLFVDEG